ncbi:unnamed protein product [Symbiodinium natans]|uniref:Uncharacterized protein n=1 Tax=Symbiodinium natans TaxID=878477 RepID=A0A812LPU8_9DINO|nr:unnamed protein product [Symbiodinium natans]
MLENWPFIEYERATYAVKRQEPSCMVMSAYLGRTVGPAGRGQKFYRERILALQCNDPGESECIPFAGPNRKCWEMLSPWIILLDLIGVAWAAESSYDHDEYYVGSNGYFYLCGSTESDWPGFTNAGYSDYVFVTLDSSGTFLAADQIGSGSHDWCQSLAVDASDSVYAVGPKGHSGGSAPATDSILVKYNSTGCRQWMVSLDGLNGGGTVSRVSIDSSGDLIVAGVIGGAFAGFASAGSDDVFVQKYNTNGIVQWSFQTGSPGKEHVEDMVLDSSDNAIVVGYNYAQPWAGQTFPDGCDGFVTVCETGFILKVDNSGNQLWMYPVTPTSSDRTSGWLRAVAADASDSIYTSGWMRADGSAGNFNGKSLSQDTQYYYLLKLNDAGSLQWTNFDSSARADALTWAASAQQLLSAAGENTEVQMKSLSTEDGHMIWAEITDVRTLTAKAIAAPGEIFYVGGTTRSGEAVPSHTSSGQEDMMVWILDARTTTTTTSRTVSTSSTITGTTSTSSTATRTTSTASSTSFTYTSTATISTSVTSTSTTSTSTTTTSTTTTSTTTTSTTTTSTTTTSTTNTNTTSTSITTSSSSSTSSSTATSTTSRSQTSTTSTSTASSTSTTSVSSTITSTASTSITSSKTSSSTTTSSSSMSSTISSSSTSTTSSSTTTSKSSSSTLSTSSTSTTTSSTTSTLTSLTATTTVSSTTTTTTVLGAFVMPNIDSASPLGALMRESLQEAVKAVVDGASSRNAITSTGNVSLVKLGGQATQAGSSDGVAMSTPVRVSVPPSLVSDLSMNATPWLSTVMMDSSVVNHLSSRSSDGPVTFRSPVVEISLMQETHGRVSVAEIFGLLTPIAIRLSNDELPPGQRCYWLDQVSGMWSDAGTEIPDHWQLRALQVAPLDGTWCLVSHLTTFVIATPPPAPVPPDNTPLVASLSSGVSVFALTVAGLCYRHVHQVLKKKKLQKEEQDKYEQKEQFRKWYVEWYPHHRHTIFSIMQTAMDEGAKGLVLLKIAADQPGTYTEDSWTDLQTDLREAFRKGNRPFSDGRLDFQSQVQWQPCSRSERLREELHHSAREETFVIIVSCIDSEVAAVKDAVRIHNKHRAPGLGKAKFAWSSPLKHHEASTVHISRSSSWLKKATSHESVGAKKSIRSMHWFSHYKFTIYGVAQTAIDEGAQGLLLLGVQPGLQNEMTNAEFPAIQKEWNRARDLKVFPFCDVGGMQLIETKTNCGFSRVTQNKLWQELKHYTQENQYVLIISCTDADEANVVNTVMRFNQERPPGHGEVKRAWATAKDMYGDRPREHFDGVAHHQQASVEHHRPHGDSLQDSVRIHIEDLEPEEESTLQYAGAPTTTRTARSFPGNLRD